MALATRLRVDPMKTLAEKQQNVVLNGEATVNGIK